MSRFAKQAGAVGTGILLQRLLPRIPNHFHPVALFGNAMTKLEQRIYRNTRNAGTIYTLTGIAAAIAAAQKLRSTTAAVTIASAGQQLRQTATQVATHTTAGNLQNARVELSALVGRNTSALDDSGIAAATIESVAENSVDAVIAPAFWGLIAGTPGVLAHRAINTMDAMVGHRNARYANFGWTSARLDDLANYLPARIWVAMVALANPIRARAILNARHTAKTHPSPNAGLAESAMAAALDRSLGGPLRYFSNDDDDNTGDGDTGDGTYEDRPILGTGTRPTPDDIHDAVKLANRVELMLAGTLLGVYVFYLGRRSRRG